ncbi:hypothetical protein BKA61DRAFT_98963 [Leptodontidium sp. MPI-SDFR-AT-0119]|nr:hypothetical protein BKA61DRAFT_98963 [Leptodontidium sp. MPI-SDFR-AT-0119]
MHPQTFQRLRMCLFSYLFRAAAPHSHTSMSTGKKRERERSARQVETLSPAIPVLLMQPIPQNRHTNIFQGTGDRSTSMPSSSRVSPTSSHRQLRPSAPRKRKWNTLVAENR